MVTHVCLEAMSHLASFAVQVIDAEQDDQDSKDDRGNCRRISRSQVRVAALVAHQDAEHREAQQTDQEDQKAAQKEITSKGPPLEVNNSADSDALK